MQQDTKITYCFYHHRKGTRIRTNVSCEQRSKVHFTAIRYNISKVEGSTKMTSKEIWNYLVDHYNGNFWTNEEIIQRDWESFFADAELFRYSKIKGEVDSHRTLQIGSYERVIPDIILKKGGNDLFVVELKKYSLHFSKEREAQLFSYLKLLHISIGVLVCDKIYIYA